jgi:hypothetical protein
MSVCPTMMIRGKLVTLQTLQGLKVWTYEGEPAQFGTGHRLVKDQTTGWSSSGLSQRKQLSEVMEGICLVQFRPSAVVDPIQTEIDQLRAMGLPTVAELVVQVARPLASVAEARLFDPGDVWFAVDLGAMGVVPSSKVTELLLKRHCNGDLGDHGRTDRVVVTDEDRFCPPLIADRAVRAAVAIEQRAGLVVSSYPVGPDRRPGRETHTVIVVIVTVIDRQGSLTLICEASHNGQRVV